MQTTIGIYVTLVVIAVILYFLTKNTAQGAGTEGFWKWLKLGTSVMKSGQRGVDKPASAPVSGDADVAAVLEDIYKEFMQETAKLRAEFTTALLESQDQLKQEIIRLQSEMEVMRSTAVDAHSTSHIEQDVPPTKVPGRTRRGGTTNRPAKVVLGDGSGPDTPDSLYFQILDELQNGKSAGEIAKLLGVSQNEVELVKSIMSSPASRAHADSE